MSASERQLRRRKRISAASSGSTSPTNHSSSVRGSTEAPGVYHDPTVTKGRWKSGTGLRDFLGARGECIAWTRRVTRTRGRTDGRADVRARVCAGVLEQLVKRRRRRGSGSSGHYAAWGAEGDKPPARRVGRGRMSPVDMSRFRAKKRRRVGTRRLPVQRGPKPEGLLAAETDRNLEVGTVYGAVEGLVLLQTAVDGVEVAFPAVARACAEAADLVG